MDPSDFMILHLSLIVRASAPCDTTGLISVMIITIMVKSHVEHHKMRCDSSQQLKFSGAVCPFCHSSRTVRLHYLLHYTWQAKAKRTQSVLLF
jgi:hypothetical protein